MLKKLIEKIALNFKLKSGLKYGENGHQPLAGLYVPGSDDQSDPLAISNFIPVGHEWEKVSLNGVCDPDRALQTLTHISAAVEVNQNIVPKIAVGVKHGNSCGASYSDDSSTAIKKMFDGNPRAIFGGVVMMNFTLTMDDVDAIPKTFLSAVMAAGFEDGVIDAIKEKAGEGCQFFENAALGTVHGVGSLDTADRFRYIRGGILVQGNYEYVVNLKEATMYGPVGDASENDVLLAWAVGSTSNSNTVTLAKDGMIIGNGVSQQDRVGAAELAIKIAGDSEHDTTGSAAYSDSFFPFPDGPGVLADAGVTSILTSSGSKKDQLSIDLCAERSVTLYMVPDPAGRGFFGH